MIEPAAIRGRCSSKRVDAGKSRKRQDEACSFSANYLTNKPNGGNLKDAAAVIWAGMLSRIQKTVLMVHCEITLEVWESEFAHRAA